MKKLLAITLLLFSINGFVEDKPKSFILECRDDWSFFGSPNFEGIAQYYAAEEILQIKYFPKGRTELKVINLRYKGYVDVFRSYRFETPDYNEKTEKGFFIYLNRGTLKINVTPNEFFYPFNKSTCEKINRKKRDDLLADWKEEAGDVFDI